MEEINQKINPIDEWLRAENHTSEDKRVVFDFAIFCGKTPKQIIEECSDSSKNSFQTIMVKDS